MQAQAGKGSGRRPSHVSQEAYASSWDRIFGKKKEMPSVFKLTNSQLQGDEVDSKTGKVKKYKDVFVIAKNQEEAIEKAKLTSDWEVVSSTPLSPQWG